MIRKGLVIAVILLIIGIAAAPTLDANITKNIKVKTTNNWIEEAKLLASDGEIYDEFGSNVAIDGKYAVIGAPKDDDNGNNAGGAYIYQRNGENWNQVEKLLASDGKEGDKFGDAVSINEDCIIIGARNDDDDIGDLAGSAYIYKHNGNNWTEEAKLIASDIDGGDKFGTSVDIYQDYAIIGAPGNDDNGSDSGSAYIFKRCGEKWIEMEKLLASDGGYDFNFGLSVAIERDTALIGAPHGYGATYVFRYNGANWFEETKLNASDGQVGDKFGWSVSLNNDYAVIGAIYDDDNGQNSGSAYIFNRGTLNWTEETKLLASDGDVDDVFGHSVSISGNYIIIGSPNDDDNGEYSGSAYVYRRNFSTWDEEKLLSSDGTAGDVFGDQVAIDGNYIIIAAREDDDIADNAGSAYIFKYPTDLSFVIEGGIGVRLSITNEDMIKSVGVDWEIQVYGGIFDLINKTADGIIDIESNEVAKVSSGIFIGLGLIDIKATVNENVKTAKGIELLIFSLIGTNQEL